MCETLYQVSRRNELGKKAKQNFVQHNSWKIPEISEKHVLPPQTRFDTEKTTSVYRKLFYKIYCLGVFIFKMTF